MKVAGKMGQDTDDQARQRRQFREGIRGNRVGPQKETKDNEKMKGLAN